jgi:catalase
MHQITFHFSDRGIPDGFRHMNGYDSYSFWNYKEERYWLKFNFITDQRIKKYSFRKTIELAGSEPD